VTPRALDLFCGAGGTARGLQLAGFHVTGIDINPQPRYAGDLFIQGDALNLSVRPQDFDLIWASPPCQAYTTMRRLGKNAGRDAPELIKPIRQILEQSGIPFVIENVPGAPLIDPIILCGSSFGLGVRRHRLFECSFWALWPLCQHAEVGRPIAVYGDHPQQPGDKTNRVTRARTLCEGQEAMGIGWMLWRELTQAVPPAYAEYIGIAAMRYIGYTPKNENTNAMQGSRL